MPLSRTLDQVLITEQLLHRPGHAVDAQAVERALLKLVRVLAEHPHQVLQMAVETALALCQAQTVGISILEREARENVFRWRAIAGKLSGAIGSAMIRDQSPCGMVLDQNTSLLFAYPELHFPFPGPVDPPIREVLLTPFHNRQGVPVGTIWIVAHDEQRKFSIEDVRIARELATFLSSALFTLVGLGYVQNMNPDATSAPDPGAANPVTSGRDCARFECEPTRFEYEPDRA